MKPAPHDIGARLDRLLARHRTPSPDRMQAAIDRVGRQIGSTEIPLSPPVVKSPGSSRPWLTAAATLALATAVGIAMLWPERGTPLYRVLEGTVHQGDTLRTNGGHAQLALTDGSRLEMRSQSAIAFERAEDGIRIRLDRGGVIVTAAEQRNGHLYVRTKDITVSVVGTVFLVNADERGSRVAVIEGEVRVQQATTEKTLLPGEQMTTTPAMDLRPVRDAIAWSRNAAALQALLQQSTAVPPPLPQLRRDPRETFEVASIRISRRVETAGGRGRPAGGACEGRIEVDPVRMVITGATANYLVTVAYGFSTSFGGGTLGCADALARKRLSGVPEWAGSERFDIEASIPDGPLAFTSRMVNPPRGTGAGSRTTYGTMREPGPRLLEMLQKLLEDRFKLVVRREMRDYPVYLLSVVPGGARLTPWKEGSSILASRSRSGTYGGSKNNIAPPKPYDPGVHVWHLSARKGTMAMLADQISGFTGDRLVIDRTGITGEFDYELFFAPEDIVSLPPGSSALTKPTLAEALKEELGLELRPSTEKVEFLVIESVERPTAN